MHTAKFLAQGLGGGLPPGWLPALTTLLAYVISFACGSSFGTMGILFPLVVPLAWSIKPSPDFTLQCVGSLLGGAIFGNTCSPIADTTILTASATGCSVASHYETQMPLTAVVAVVALVFGTIPCGFGWYNAYVGILLSLLALTALLFSVGRRPEDDDSRNEAEADTPVASCCSQRCRRRRGTQDTAGDVCDKDGTMGESLISGTGAAKA